MQANKAKALLMASVLTVFLTVVVAMNAVSSSSYVAPTVTFGDESDGFGVVAVEHSEFINQSLKDEIVALIVWAFVIIIIISICGYIVMQLRHR